MNIQLVSTKAIKILLEPCDDVKEGSFSFDYTVQFDSAEDSNSFLVGFKAALDHDEGFRGEIVYIANFETDGSIDAAFKNGKFPYVNAPAIGYPFLRAFLANFLLNAGLKPFYLPSVNFEKMYADSKKANSSKSSD